MKKYNLIPLYLVLALVLASVLAGPGWAQKTIDRIVATVNNDIITLSQLNRRADPLIRAQRAQGAAAEQIRRKVLEAMIDQTLGVQQARKMNLSVTDADVDAAIASIMKQHNITLDQMRAGLAQQGTTLELFKEDIKLEILKSKVLSIQVRQKVVITDSEIEALLSGQSTLPESSFVGGAGASQVRMIVLPVASKNSKNFKKVTDEAKRIKAEIDNGLDFAQAAAKYSQGPGRDSGGLVEGGVTAADLDSRLKRAAESLAPGKASVPVALDDSVVIIMLEPQKNVPSASPAKKKKGKGKVDLSKYSQAQIDQARNQLGEVKLKAKFDTWVSDLKKRSSITINL